MKFMHGIKHAAIALTVFASLTLSVYADPLCRIETSSGGNAEIIGYDIVQGSGKEMLIVLLNYENTTGKSASPGWNISVKAFSDGIQLNDAYSYNFEYDDTYYSKMTEIRPGGVLPYYVLFEKPKSDNVEIELDALISFGNTSKVVQLDMSKLGIVTENSPESAEAPAPSDEAAAASTAEQPTETDEQKAIRKLKKRVAKLETRIGELEERIAQLENA